MQNTAAGSLSIGLLAWDYPPTPSGLSVAAGEIAQSLAARGHRVRVLTLDRLEDGRDGAVEILGAGRHLTPALAALREKTGTGHLAAPIAFRRAVEEAAETAPFDLIEATNWYAPAACLAPLGLPLVTRLSTPAAASAGSGGPFDDAAATALERHQVQHAAGLISNTAHHAEAMARHYGVSAEGPGHAVIGLSLPPSLIAEGAEAPAPAAGPPFRLLFVGRATRRKGFDAVLAAARSLPPGVTVRLCGVGREDLSPEAPDALIPLGALSRDRLVEELAACHAVLAPSRYESFGLVYREAAAFGRPLVACAEDPAAKAFIGAHGLGVLAETCNGEALAAATLAILQDVSSRNAARRRGLALAETLGRETLGRKTEKAFATVLERHRRPELRTEEPRSCHD